MYILGIHDCHNSTAALMKDGKILSMLSEERLTYRKNEMGFPEQAVQAMLDKEGITGADVGRVVFSSRSVPLDYLRIKREFSFTIRDWLQEQEEYWKPLIFEGRQPAEYLEKLWGQERFQEPQSYDFSEVPLGVKGEENDRYLQKIREEFLARRFDIAADKVMVCIHHDCHQHYAYFGSPFRDEPCLILTGDGGGDGSNGTVALAENNRITQLASNNCSDLARIYRYITLMLGMKIGEHEYKVMGLAPYATDYEIKKCDKVFKDLFHVPGMLIEYKNRPEDLYFHFRDALADCRFDGIAGAVQQMVEEVGTTWVRQAIGHVGVARMVFSGGLAMNVKLNQQITELDCVQEFYCPASGGDESLALGACYVACAELGMDMSTVSSIEDNYLGTDLSDDEEDLAQALASLEDVKVIEGVTVEQVAELLAEDKIIGRFCGRMEFGARSLGNRSIIANPANLDNLKKINEKIKFRDFWMPFAPSILAEKADRYVYNDKGMLSDHMTVAFHTTEEGKRDLAAALHPADHTVRAHLVRREVNPDYCDLIEAFEAKTGVSALVNTSFNLHGYPVVSTATQAVHVFANSELDAMLLEDTLVLRKSDAVVLDKVEQAVLSS